MSERKEYSDGKDYVKALRLLNGFAKTRDAINFSHWCCLFPEYKEILKEFAFYITSKKEPENE